MKENNWYFKYLFIKILYIIIIPIVACDIIMIVQTLFNPEAVPNIFGYKTFNIISESMTPNICKNDVIVVKMVEQPELKVNDIISFKSDDEIVTHRITKIEGRNGSIIYTTKGDGNEIEDIDKVEYKDIEGKYIFKIPQAGNVLLFFKNTKILFVILIIFASCYIFEKNKVSNKIKRKKKRRKWERENICCN